jgi:DNA-directed RNA polymerase specialized sigma24 family protein
MMTPPANSDKRGPKGGERSRGQTRKGGASSKQGGGQRGQGQGGKKRGGRRDEPDNPAEQLRGPLEKVLARLPETQRKVLEMRMGLTDGHPHDLADTARELGLSMSEARDIEKRAFEHIREAVPLQQLQRFLGH